MGVQDGALRDGKCRVRSTRPPYFKNAHMKVLKPSTWSPCDPCTRFLPIGIRSNTSLLIEKFLVTIEAYISKTPSVCRIFWSRRIAKNRTGRVGGVWYAGVEVGMVCRYAFAEPPRRFMRVCRYRYRASGRLYTPHARKHGGM